MPNIIISGCNGHMGQTLTAICRQDESIRLVAGFDADTAQKNSYPVYFDPMEFSGKADVVIDFSVPEALSGLLRYCLNKKTPLVLCATGYSEADEARILEAAKTLPVFQSGNMSLGLNLLVDLAKKAAQVLGLHFDIEIIDRHHNRKIDAPSGSAFMLADAIRESLPYAPHYVYERQSVREPRGEREIGISSIRGGTIVGEHEVIFAGLDEVIELKHAALSPTVFASGALTAAKFLSGVTKPGLYTMSHIVTQKGAYQL